MDTGANYIPELITAIIIASTSLLGLTGLFFCYIRFHAEARQHIDRHTFHEIRLGLSYSTLFSIVAVVSSLIWYLNQSNLVSLIATLAFMCQLISFGLSAYYLRLFILN